MLYLVAILAAAVPGNALKGAKFCSSAADCHASDTCYAIDIKTTGTFVTVSEGSSVPMDLNCSLASSNEGFNLNTGPVQCPTRLNVCTFDAWVAQTNLISLCQEDSECWGIDDYCFVYDAEAKSIVLDDAIVDAASGHRDPLITSCTAVEYPRCRAGICGYTINGPPPSLDVVVYDNELNRTQINIFRDLGHCLAESLDKKYTFGKMVDTCLIEIGKDSAFGFLCSLLGVAPIIGPLQTVIEYFITLCTTKDNCGMNSFGDVMCHLTLQISQLMVTLALSGGGAAFFGPVGFILGSFIAGAINYGISKIQCNPDHYELASGWRKMHPELDFSWLEDPSVFAKNVTFQENPTLARLAQMAR